VIVGRFILDHVFRLIARTRVTEAMTAAALLTVVGVAIVMQQAGLSASLGAFIAGALLSESSYRHQLEADIKPFEGLLLGLFFTAIGMSLNVALLVERPLLILALVAVLVAIKSVALYAVGLWYGLERAPARRLAFTLSQGGEFAFVLFTAGTAAGVLGQGQAEVFAVVVTLSMVATPLLLVADRMLMPPAPQPVRAFDAMPENDGHVVIAGFGRFGQIVGRVLRAKHIPFTALDVNPDQIAFVERFGAKAFYGDASRAEILEAAQTSKARAFVLAIDDVEASMRTVEHLREHYPNLPIYARARNRIHAHRLMDAGVKLVRRETFLASLDLTRELLTGIGYSAKEAERTVKIFRAHDERRLSEDYKHWTDEQKLQEKARTDAANLERLFDEDAAEDRKAAEREKLAPEGASRREMV
jgi:glutathione-regulated potassium-efflux system protein KefB